MLFLIEVLLCYLLVASSKVSFSIFVEIICILIMVKVATTWWRILQEGPVISAHSVQVARFLFINSHARKSRGTPTKIVETLNLRHSVILWIVVYIDIKSLVVLLPKWIWIQQSVSCSQQSVSCSQQSVNCSQLSAVSRQPSAVRRQRFHISSQQNKSAVSEFFKFSANQVSSQ